MQDKIDNLTLEELQDLDKIVGITEFNKDLGLYMMDLNNKAYADRSNKKLTLVGKVLALISKFSEMLDSYKDVIYLFVFRHSFKYLLILIFSIAFPASVQHQLQMGIYLFSITHTLMVYFHLSSNPMENDARREIIHVVAGFENIPQFYVQMREMIELRYSVNII